MKNMVKVFGAAGILSVVGVTLVHIIEIEDPRPEPSIITAQVADATPAPRVRTGSMQRPKRTESRVVTPAEVIRGDNFLAVKQGDAVYPVTTDSFRNAVVEGSLLSYEIEKDARWQRQIVNLKALDFVR